MPRAYTARIGGTSSAGPGGPAGTVAQRWLGAVTPTSAAVSVKTATATQTRLRVSASADMSSPVYGPVATVDADGISRPTITGLTPSTRYYYQVEAGPAVSSPVRQFATFPPAAEPASFLIGLVACQDATDSPAWPLLLARDPIACVHLGDFFYDDGGVTTAAGYRASYDARLQAANTGAAFAQIPMGYLWSDHDFGKNNNTVGATFANKGNAQSVWAQYAPYWEHPAADGGIYQSFGIGRVRLILCDTRSYKSLQTDTDNTSKRVLGATQEQWLYDTAQNCAETAVLVCFDQPWTNMSGADDEWANYNTERQRIATNLAAIRSSTGKHISIVAGDMHALGFDNGTNSPGSFPVFQSAPLNNSPSVKGTYSGGTYGVATTASSPTTYAKQYATLEVVDDGGTTIQLIFRGYDEGNVQRLTATVNATVPAYAVQPVGQVSGWTLTMADHFNERSLDTTRWFRRLRYGFRWIPTQPETNWYDDAGVTVGGGMCRLTATRETYPLDTNQLYRSGMIATGGGPSNETLFGQQYGWWEVRCRKPQVPGTWAALVMYPTPDQWPWEIDLDETYGNDPAGEVYADNLWYDLGGGAGAQQVGAQDHATTVRDWHTYAVQWTPTELRFYLDGVQKRLMTGAPVGTVNTPGYIGVYLAISRDQNPNPADYPQSLDIDYVRVWSAA